MATKESVWKRLNLSPGDEYHAREAEKAGYPIEAKERKTGTIAPYSMDAVRKEESRSYRDFLKKQEAEDGNK